ncbi:thiamine diphosphokinase [Chryseobacterium salipaludis]|uniref:thiamine diphosphokinase n=1 Tax=Chryseobacterium TaxID=59732 RepID=UPI001FF5B450|nr:MULTISPECIES: thiamine diphosphokinase [Chryseobacterium]MCJ8498736.1 thiamine diphosphokinase [Chryseobacterium salipaludis]MCX3297612.1 thiamine diphosphokinase [Planobacterium sp. JC490]
MTAKKALLFINGVPPARLPDADAFDVVACSDGAFDYLKSAGFNFSKLNFVSGDFDSQAAQEEVAALSAEYGFEILPTPDQDKTDFCKALEILAAKDCTEVSVYGGSGGEMDHFLGNLTVASQFQKDINITFFDEYARYFFAAHHTVLDTEPGQMISLYPFPEAKYVVSTGLEWPLFGEDLNLTSRIGTRNRAVDKQVEVSYQQGSLIIFVAHPAARDILTEL